MTRRLRRIALVLTLSAVASLGAAAPSAHAAAGMEIAVQDDAVFVTQAYLKHAKAFPLAQQLQVKWIRVNIGWAAVMPSRQANARSKPSKVDYDFTAYDHLINAARDNGMQLEVGLTGNAPRWATGDKKKAGPFKPNAKLFREFASAAASHFGDNVNRYSIWNEPNHTGWLAPLKSQPALYRALYSQGYSAVKSANRNAQVLIGETAPYASRKGVAMPPLEFLRKMLNRGRLVADGYAHHPYDFKQAPNRSYPGRDNVTLSGLSKLTKALDGYAKKNRLEKADGSALDVYLTEFGYLRSGRQKQSESNRAKYLRMGYDMALKNPRVRQMLHFLLAQPTKKYLFFDTSIVSRSGGKTGAFNALADWASDNLNRINGAGG